MTATNKIRADHDDRTIVVYQASRSGAPATQPWSSSTHGEK